MISWPRFLKVSCAVATKKDRNKSSGYDSTDIPRGMWTMHMQSQRRAEEKSLFNFEHRSAGKESRHQNRAKQHTSAGVSHRFHITNATHNKERGATRPNTLSSMGQGKGLTPYAHSSRHGVSYKRRQQPHAMCLQIMAWGALQ